MYLGDDKAGRLVTAGLYIEEGGGDGEQVPFVNVAVNVEMVDVVAEVTFTYKFINTRDRPIDPTYVPLSYHNNFSNIYVDNQMVIFTKVVGFVFETYAFWNIRFFCIIS